MVLKSKNLLTDHIELLDDYLTLKDIQEPGRVSGLFWATTAATIGGASITGLAIKSSGNLRLGGIAIGVALGLGAGYHWRSLYHYQKENQRLSLLLDVLNQYRNILKRNLMYLTDSSHLNGIPSERDSILSSSCVNSCLVVINLLHQFVSELDERSPITKELVDYEPFEDLGNCEQFLDQDTGLKNFKSLYTIFLFIQSQFMLRLVIALAENREPIENDLLRVTKKLQIEATRDDLQIVVKKEIKAGQENAVKISSLIDKEGKLAGLRQLKWTTNNLSTKLVLQLNQFERFKDNLELLNDDASPSKNKKKLMELNEGLSAIESLFVSTACEFENVQLLMRKALNIESEVKKAVPSAEVADESGLPLKVVDQSTAIDIDDEFFILDGQMAEKESTGFDAQVDDVRNERVLKTSFKPVLKQLRKQIDPLNEEMIERERKFLQQQGVELPTVDPVKLSVALYSSSTESEDELDEDMVLRKKKLAAPKPSKYDENRKFLEEKVQMGVFRLPAPAKFADAHEDLLE